MKLVDYLVRKELTADQFATMISVGTETVRRYIRGERFPNRNIISRIEVATKGAVTANDLMMRDLSKAAAE
jgi:hypothetical protein